MTGFLNYEEALFDAAQKAYVTHQLALAYAVLLDRTKKKINQDSLFASVRRWEPRMPKTLKRIDSVIGALIKVWGGNERASQWTTLLSMDKEWNNNALELESREATNLNAIIAFAVHGTPLRSQADTMVLPDLSSLSL